MMASALVTATAASTTRRRRPAARRLRDADRPGRATRSASGSTIGSLSRTFRELFTIRAW
jgi:hypothetical protein